MLQNRNLLLVKYLCLKNVFIILFLFHFTYLQRYQFILSDTSSVVALRLHIRSSVNPAKTLTSSVDKRLILIYLPIRTLHEFSPYNKFTRLPSGSSSAAETRRKSYPRVNSIAARTEVMATGRLVRFVDVLQIVIISLETVVEFV